MKHFGGKVLFLDRSNINTDEIIPAKYLVTNEKKSLQPHLLEDLRLTGFDPAQNIAGKGAVVTRANFGCGSSREHAPWALEMNEINIVIGESFARIFRQNMYNCGMIACELPPSVLDEIFSEFSGKDTELTVDIEGSLHFNAGGITKTVHFTLSSFEKALISVGGWLQYVELHY